MPKDEILDGSEWKDVEPQAEVVLDGSTWTEVKKKDVPAPKLESGSEATISSNGQSKSKSTSASTIVSKPNPINQTSFTVSKENNFGIPNFQVQGIQKNTFQPLTEQQKAAGKKVLGEGTPLVEKKKVNIETPETSAKKSAILKAVTGKDISYDEVSRLSDVSNTDYAGILAAQKEKQKTDNTFATNPALQEEQRQEQVKQSEFLGNREFKVNNPQANVQILEQKNPTLLKDIADKTLELDEQRTAESFNKDKPVSQRFSKPKNDVPYKPFTDYLEVEELATVSPMELYETREKESDREKQFKYFKDRGADNVFNEYDNEQTAISFKQGELKKKHETALKNLKAKYGEDINNVEIPQDDKDFVDIIAAQNGLKENYNLSKDLLKTDKYAEVNKTIQERANRQVEIDKTAKDDTWYKFGDEYNKLNNVVMNTAYGLVNDIASLPRFINGLAGENDFNWTDKVADATARFTDAGMAYFNTPTDVQRDNVQDYAEVDGYRVFLDKKGNPTSLRDADNFMVNNDAKKEEIFTKYSDNKDKIKVKTDWIDGEQIMNQSSKIIGDMLVMIAEGGGIGAGIKGVGKVSRSARILNLAENAKLTTSLAVISQMQNEMMNDAIDKGMSKEDAAKYSAISSAGVAAISLINPMEAQFLKNIKNVKSLASEEVTSFLNGNTTLADLSKKTIGAVIGNSVPEIAEEQFFEPVLQNVVNDSYKNQVGVNEQLDQTDVLGRENLAQSVLTATTTFLPSALESSKNMNSNSIKMNILENPENWMAIIDKKKELGIIEDDVYSAEVAAMNKAKKKYDALKSEVKQSDRTKLAGLIGDKVAIESKLSDAPELKPKYENQVKEIDSKISNLTNGITEAPKIEQAGAINIQSQDFGAEAKQDAKIESAVIEIGGKIYEGKNHAEAILKAKADGQDISQVNRQAEGKFKLSDGTIIDRAESKSRFGQDRSELMIPQDENAKEANKEYAKITRKPLSKIAEKIKLDENQVTPIKPINTGQEQNNIGGVQQTPENNQGFQQGDGQNVSNENEVAIKKQETVNDKVLSTKNEEITPKSSIEVDRNVDRNEILAEIKSKNLTHVKGKNMGENQALGTYISTEKGNRYETPTQKAEKVEVDIENPYVVDNGDFGLVDKRQEVLNNNRDKFTAEDSNDYQELPKGKLTVDDLNDAGIKKLAELTTNELKAQGYDAIYFKESDTQEGELVVFDKEKVKFEENIINLVEDKAENELANNKLTEKDNIEQDPSIKDIEGKAESNNEVELNEVVKKSDELINNAIGIQRVPLSNLNTDENRFQARDELNQDIIDDIANNFSDANQDPIHVWTDPKDGKTYVLSGHHRYYGAKKAGKSDVKIIDRTNDFTEREAIIFATEEANANRSMETPLERANTLRKKRERGDSKEEINTFLDKEGKNKPYTDNLSRLNPKGKAIQSLKSLQNSTDKTTQKETERIADWIGDARKSINGLTDAHENEMFDFLMDKDTSKRITNKADFLQKVRSLANPLMPEVPLSLSRLKYKSQGESQYDEDVANKKAEIADRQNKIDAINDRFSNPANPSYIRTESADYAQARKIADDRISKLDAERKSLQKQLEDIYRSKGKYTSANTTGSLFQSTDKNFTPISKSKFNELLDKLKKAFPNVKVELFGKNDFENARKELEANGIKIQDIQTKDGTIYGFKTPDGKVFLNSDNLNANTPIHEYGHIWQSIFPQGFVRGIELLKLSPQGQALIREIQKNPAYKGKSLAEIHAEALVTAIGNKGEQTFKGNPSALKRFQEWLTDFFKTIGDKLGIKDLSSDDKLDMFTKKVVGELLGGKVLDSKIGTENKSGEVDLQMDKAIKQAKDIQLKYNDKGEHLASNGKSSNLTEQQAKIVRTDAFKNWFGDWENNPKEASKVVDENGEPLVVYHGTNSEFTEFKQNNRSYGSGDTYGFLGNGFYFTNNFDTADSYSNYSGNVLPVFLNIKKPYISTNWEHTSPSRQGSFAKDLGVSVGEETTFLKGKNHDGVISTDEDYAEYLIYNPNQIKSATNNVGTFSNENNDIRFQVKDGLKEFVEDAKKEGYTKQETIDYVKDNNPEINEQDVIDTWDAVNEKAVDEKKEKAGKEKRLQNRAFDGTTDEELKSIIEDYGLTYETESQIIAEKEANDIIEEVGLERAFQAVQNGYIKGAQAAVVYAKMVDELDTKLADDKITAEERTRLKELQAYSIDIFDTEARDAGRFLAMLNRMYQKSLFTYDTMVKSATKAKGAPLTAEEKLQLKEQSEKIAEFDKKIKELEAKLDEERAQNAVKNIKALNNKPKTASFKAKAKALADKFRQLKSKPLVLKDADGNPIELTQNSIVSYNDIIELAAKAIEKTGELLDGINTALQEIKKQKWYQNLSQRDKDAVDRQVKEELLNLDTEVSDDKFKIPNSLLREIVRNGTEDIDGIVEKVLEVYGDIYPELKDDKRKVRDIITKYGETIESKEDLIGDKLALAKRIGRLLSAKDDLLSGKLPKKSGFQREKPGATERLLMQEIQQLLKNVPKSQEELDALWATALDKAKNRVKNRIEELQLAIDREERIKKSKTVQNYNDAKLDELKSQLKEKQAEYDAAFPKEKSTLSDEQRLNQLINSKKKRLEKLEKQKIDKVYETNKKEGPDKSKFPELAKQIADLDAEIKKVNDEIKADETWKTHVEKKRLELAKKANQRRIDELKRRIDEKDFIVKKNPTPIDDELKQLRREKHKVADDYELAKHKFELENRSPTEKAVDGILDILTLPKSLKATLDLSAPLRQGATVLLSNPQIFWNSFIKMHGQAFNEKTFEDSIDEIMKSDNYTLAQDSGLQITDPASADERKQDDQFTVKLVNKIPIFNKLNQGSARAYSGFLNNIRFSLFEQGVKELEAAGYKYEDNPKMFKALASTVNNLTGRGRSADGITGKFLNFILFSPRMITSRVLLLHDLMRTDIPFNSPSRKMAAKSLLGTAVYIGLFNLLGTVISNASGDDDDKDRKPNFNPVATDFLKVRSKQTTFDPTAGYAPLIRTAARIATEKSINSRGRETDLSKAYGSTRYATAFDFFENKLSPTVSYLAAVTTHKNPDNKYESASEAEWYDYITGLVAPLQVMQVAQNFNDKDKFGKDLLEVILGLYGIGVQQYDNTGSGKGDSSGTTSGTDSRGSDSRGTTSGTDSRGSDSRTTAR